LKRASTFSETSAKSSFGLPRREVDLSKTVDTPELLAKEVTAAVSQLEKLYVQRLRNFYSTEMTEISKTVRLPIPKQTESFEWDMELTNIMGSLRT
jgi:hypothetical protein